MMESNLLRREEARQYLGVSESTFDRLMKERAIPYIRIRQRIIRFRLSDLDRYLLDGLVEPRQDNERQG